MNFKNMLVIGSTAAVLAACGGGNHANEGASNDKDSIQPITDDFKYMAEQFADLKLIRYKINGFDKLSPKQKELAYYLYQAGLSGRDMIWDQNNKHNLAVRHALESIYENFNGDKNSPEFAQFMEYTKRVWFSNGIHHHYSKNKITPEFTENYLRELLRDSKTELAEEHIAVIFNPELEAKGVNLDPKTDLIKGSANNFYVNLTEKEVESYYNTVIPKGEKNAISYGLNSQMVKEANGKIVERTYKIGGLYSGAIEKVVFWLEKAATVAENPQQQKALELLVEYYKTGDLKIWDDYNIAWVKDTTATLDYINGFIEVYGDAKGFRGTFESVVQMKDFEASERMKLLGENVQWFEDNSSIMAEHKKAKVTGVSYKVVTVIGESGDASPSTPIGVNLPNANWIRAEHGSKSVSLGNIIEAYDKAGSSGMTKEFCYTPEELERAEKYGALAGKLHTALHEVVGHASGKINDGVGTPKETLKSYSSTLEEARADLVALYYLIDPKLIELGLMESIEVGKAEYDSYIRNGLLTQLRRIEPGEVLEEAHMRNRQTVAAWVFEKGKSDNVTEKKVKDGKTYFVVNDYEKLRVLFGDLLREIQRIKSEGDYEAGKNLVENYGVQIDQAIHQEVIARTEKLNIAPYGGFINPLLVPVMEGDKIIDVKVEYPEDFTEQMMYYGKTYSFLPFKY